MTVDAATMKTMSAAARDVVYSMYIWDMPSIGAVAPTFEPQNRMGQSVQVRYAGMPALMTDYGRKAVTLQVRHPETNQVRRKWVWYNHVEFFFAARGYGASGIQTEENWFYYWKQVRYPQNGSGNPQLVFRQGSSYVWNFLGKSGSLIELQFPDSLFGYVGMLAHEESHELDFFNIIWEGNGYNAISDSDQDFLRDTWEASQPGGTAGNLSSYFESTAGNQAWSDDKADEAALAEANAHLGINALDWSDIVVSSGKTERFFDENRPKEARESKETTAGSNKGIP